MPIQRLWDVLKIANIVTSTMLDQNTLPDEVSEYLNSESGALGCAESSLEEWKVQGIKFFKKKQFDQAMKCFGFANEPKLVVKS
jgi:hypothetical protein